jgi:hypothetical protein
MKIPFFFIKMVIFGKNNHFSSKKKCNFHFFKTPIKSRTKKIYYYFRHFFHFLLLKKIKIKKAKVGQKLGLYHSSFSKYPIFQILRKKRRGEINSRRKTNLSILFKYIDK